MAVTCECPRCGRTRRLMKDELSCVQCCKYTDNELFKDKVNNYIDSIMWLLVLIVIVAEIIKGFVK